MVRKANANQKRRSRGEKAFDVCNILFLSLLAMTTLYPFVFILSGSISDINAIIKNQVVLFPIGFSLDGYKSIIADGQILTAYGNTLWYTIVGTLINLAVTLAAAYPLSRKSYPLRGPLMLLISATMFFSGGLVPFYLLIQNLGLYNTRWVMVIPGALSVTNLVMARVFFSSNIPDEMSESAKIDGANDIQTFLFIVLPLSKAIIAVLALYYGVGHWNNFYNAMVYLRDADKTPLALYLRRILILGTTNYAAEGLVDSEMVSDPIRMNAMVQQMKYCSIIVTMAPILFIYPFFQKYFAKGVMIGALKA